MADEMSEVELHELRQQEEAKAFRLIGELADLLLKYDARVESTRNGDWIVLGETHQVVELGDVAVVMKSRRAMEGEGMTKDEPDHEAELDQQWNALLKNDEQVCKLYYEAGQLFSREEQWLTYVIVKLREQQPLDD